VHKRDPGPPSDGFTNPKPKMKVIIHSIVATEMGNLCPAPGMRDWEYMKEFLDADTTPRIESLAEIIGAPLELLTSYRGSLIYLAGGVTFNRTNPTTTGANGHMSLPTANVTEHGMMTWQGITYLIEAEFVV